MSYDNGQPAFPIPDPFRLEPTNHAEMMRLAAGMTLRDYFAAKAMPAAYAELCAHARNYGWPDEWRSGIAADAYAMADAMLKERAK